MSKPTWQQKAAKRLIAESALRLALAEIEQHRNTGGPKSFHADGYTVARHLAQHAADQLRLAEGE